MGRRNFQGGNKTKAMKKGSTIEDSEIRTILSDEEEYAIVTAVCGNGRFKVTSQNNINYMAILPGSMRGSKKRNSYVELNSIILINNRSSWQTIKTNSTVDITHVYSQNHISHLKLFTYFNTQLKHTSNSDNILFLNDQHLPTLLPQNDHDISKNNSQQTDSFDIQII